MVAGTLKMKKERMALLSALVVLLSLTAGMMHPGTGPEGPLVSQMAAVTIKTQEAADRVPNAIRGVDVSVYQENVDWAKVTKDNVKFTIIRASFGLETDKNFYDNVSGASSAGLKVGAYHYAKFTDRASMLKEAEYFLDVLESVKGKMTYPVVLDLEGNAHKAMGKNTLTPLVIEFLDMIKAKGYTPMLYTYDNFYKDYLNASSLADYELWIANYVEEPSVGQALWQHTSYGTIDGISTRALIDIAYKDLSVKKGLVVNKTISNSIKQTLNERHGSGLSMEGLDMKEMKMAVVTALQSELIRQMDADIAVTGQMNQETLQAFDEIPFIYGETKGNITYLIQVMLFYKGHYTESLTGAYDAHTLEAMKSYQRSIDEEATGTMDWNTIWYLFK